jgi:N-terminal acetyltransferase B complex non-catalytic subunit
LDDAREFLRSLQEIELQLDDCKRGPFLAELELEERAISKIKDYKPAKEMDTLVIEYSQKFGAKAICSDDLKPYLKNNSLETSRKFIEVFKASIDSTSEDEKVSKKFFQILSFLFYTNFLLQL